MSAAVELPDSIKAAVDVFVAIAFLCGPTPQQIERDLLDQSNQDVLVLRIIDLAKQTGKLPSCFTPTQECHDAIVNFFVAEFHDCYAFCKNDQAEAFDDDLVLQ